MSIKKIILFSTLLLNLALNAQNKVTFLDSIKSTFKKNDFASKVDSLWLKELTSINLYETLQQDIATINLDQKVDYELPKELLKSRLKALDAKSPFNIEYNEGLENIIKSFLKNRKKSYERLMALSEYYFPLFEEALAKKNVPLEIKYLAIVESALNPKATSRVGATGLWQFMYQTGKQYDLKIDSYVDERSDPLLASNAAATYMTNMYKIFGEWDLVLASYNSGPGNVSKAIRRSNGQKSFWNIRKFLPKETQGYVPAFLATMYIFEYHKEHGIVPERAMVKHFATDTILVKQQLSFKQISDLLDIPVAQLKTLNPSYKIEVVPHYNDRPHYIRLPIDKIAVFTSNEDKIYAYANYDINSRKDKIIKKQEKSLLAFANDTNLEATTKIVYKNINKVRYHKVRKGDSMGEICDKYNVSSAEVKQWNHLKNNKVPLGRRLKIIETDVKKTIVVVRKPKTRNIHKDTLIAENTKPEEPKPSSTTEPQYYVVEKGDNLSKIAKKFKVSESDLKAWNDLADNKINLDTKLKILNSEVSVEELSKSNEDKPQYHIVADNESIWKIAKQYNVSAANIKRWNDLKSMKVAEGDKLIILNNANLLDTKNSIAEKKSKKQKIKEYKVRKGDTLIQIAQKFPGVSVADLKNWNKIKGNQLRPGMKLKINS